MICVSRVYASDAFGDGLRAPPRTGRFSPAASANGVTSRATSTAATTIHGPWPRIGVRVRMRLSIGESTSLADGRQANAGARYGGTRRSLPLPLQHESAGEGCGPARPLSDHREERPAARHVAQVVRAAVLEAEARADDRAVDRPGREHLARLGERGDARCDVHGHPADVVREHLALARVQPDAHGEPERLQTVDDRLRAAHRPRRRAVERDEERVADRLHLAPAEAVELAADDRVVGDEQVAPAGVAEAGGVPGRADDVAEQEREEVALDRRAPGP